MKLCEQSCTHVIIIGQVILMHMIINVQSLLDPTTILEYQPILSSVQKSPDLRI